MHTPYELALASLTRREFLNIAWKLGASAALLPLSSHRLWAKPVFDSYPFTLGVASGTTTAYAELEHAVHVDISDTRQYRSRQACRMHAPGTCLDYMDTVSTSDRSIARGARLIVETNNPTVINT